jgi:hypothetical protein
MEAAQPAPYAIAIVACPQAECKAKQAVQISSRGGSRTIAPQSVVCLKCHETFLVMVPNEITAGPFLIEV